MLVAFTLCALLAAACWWLLPRAGVYIPAYIPLLGFVVIFIAAALLLAPELRAERDDDKPAGWDDAIAGHIESGDDDAP